MRGTVVPPTVIVLGRAEAGAAEVTRKAAREMSAEGPTFRSIGKVIRGERSAVRAVGNEEGRERREHFRKTFD